MIRLAWPNRDLWPNSRKDRRAVAPVRKAYRQAAGWATLAAGFRKLNWDQVHARITFHPPNGIRRDLDNMLAAVKSGIDGIVDVIGVDDSLWEITIRRGGVVNGGAVMVEFILPTDTAQVVFRGSVT